MPRLPTDDEMNALENVLKDTITIEKLQLIRNAFLAGSALCVTILIAMTQIAERPTSLFIANLGAALAMPLCSVLAYVVHVFIHLGESYLEKYNSFRTNRFYYLMQLVACAALVTSMGSIVYFLHQWALIVFIVSCVTGIAFFLYAGAFVTINNAPQSQKTMKKK